MASRVPGSGLGFSFSERRGKVLDCSELRDKA